ncbi:MAG: hypothetical protein JRN32_01450 [Nitrososphaerota archaeon]|jgi:hypothetical protein|nr:hypothetical protein [Nitrososphaerota archaeon]MDG7036140.1 hypothetical protein [Nitrososphaerota archaeon]MDG7037794.1 hypothetical protein [Nitrososphaerota archaeon]MDG7045466.1 hypothetical protein [Nitrososphaerota archaeon]
MNEEGRAPLQGGHNGEVASTNKSTHLFERTIDDGTYKLQVCVNALGRIVVSINEISITVLAEDGLEAVWHELILAGAFGPAVPEHDRFRILNNISFMHRDAVTWLAEAQKRTQAKHNDSRVQTLADLFKEESEKMIGKPGSGAGLNFKTESKMAIFTEGRNSAGTAGTAGTCAMKQARDK